MASCSQQISHPSKDLLLAHLATPSFDIAPLPLNPGPLPGGPLPAIGATCTGVGFGAHNESNGSVTFETKRSCTEIVESANTTTAAVRMVSGVADHGDSGGPLLCGGAIAAVVHNHTDGDWPTHIRENYATIDRPWLLSHVGHGANVAVQSTTSGELDLWSISNGALASNLSLGAPPLDWQVAGAGDFNGDGQGDILWRHSNGQVAIWFMAGFTNFGQAYPGGQDPGHVWSIQGVGDFNSDGRADILWRDTSGQLAI